MPALLLSRGCAALLGSVEEPAGGEEHEHREAREEERQGEEKAPALPAALFFVHGHCTATSPASAKGGTSSTRSPLQKRPGSYQLAGRRLGSRPMCWKVVATSSAQ